MYPIQWIYCIYVYTVSYICQPPLSSPNKPMNKVAMMAGREVMHGLSKTDWKWNCWVFRVQGNGIAGSLSISLKLLGFQWYERYAL